MKSSPSFFPLLVNASYIIFAFKQSLQRQSAISFSVAFVMKNGCSDKIVPIETLISFLSSLSCNFLIVAFNCQDQSICNILYATSFIGCFFDFNILIIQTTLQSQILQLCYFNCISAISAISTIDTVLHPNIYTLSYLI